MIALTRSLLVGFDPDTDPRWLPEGMSQSVLYQVVGYENGEIKRRDNTKGEALFLLFVGDGHKLGRILASNAVCVPAEGKELDLPGGGAALWDQYLGRRVGVADAAARI